jgi:hypothetical protein
MDLDGLTWEKLHAPYDPRQVNGITLSKDEFGWIVEAADCGISCPGAGFAALVTVIRSQMIIREWKNLT